MTRVEVIAEAGVNHNGDVELACRLVQAAARAGADTLKLQTFVPERVVSQHAAIQQTLDQLDLVADRVVAPDLLLQRSRRAAAVQAYQRVPAPLVGGGEILDEA